MPERTFTAHPELKPNSYTIHAFQADDERAVLTEQGIRDVFGSPSSNSAEVSDVAFVFGERA